MSKPDGVSKEAIITPGHIQEVSARPIAIRDTREKDGHGYHFKEGKYFAGTQVKKLDSGDYSILGHEDVIAIERKMHLNELCNCLTKSRWHAEIERLKLVKHAFIVIEAPFHHVIDYPNTPCVPRYIRSRIKISSNFIMSRIAMYELAGISVIWAGDADGGKRVTGYLLANAYKTLNE